jgi:hypothetical protein
MTFMSNLNTFGPEKSVVTREVESGLYTIGPYFTSRWITEVPFRIIFPSVYATILYWMIFDATADKYAIFLACLILLDNAGSTMSLVICAMFPDVQMGACPGACNTTGNSWERCRGKIDDESLHVFDFTCMFSFPWMLLLERSYVDTFAAFFPIVFFVVRLSSSICFRYLLSKFGLVYSISHRVPMSVYCAQPCKPVPPSSCL